jgi:hypothetical protein
VVSKVPGIDREFARYVLLAATLYEGPVSAANLRDPAGYLAAIEGAAGRRDLPGMFEELAQLYLLAGRAEEAVPVMRLAVDAGLDGTPDARCELARYLLRAGQAEEAGSLLAQVKADTPGDVWLFNVAGGAYQQTGGHEAALTWLAGGLRLALDTGDPEGLGAELLEMRGDSLTALGREADQVQREAEAAFGPSRPAGETSTDGPLLLDQAMIWGALDRAYFAEQHRGSPWHGVFARLLARSVRAAMAGETARALLDKRPAGRAVAEKVAADLPGGLEQLQAMPAWQLARRHWKRGNLLDAYGLYEGYVIEFAWAAQAALRAYADGTAPAGPDQLLPGEDDGKGHAHDWPDLPLIPDGIDRRSPGLKLLNEADARLRDIYLACEPTAQPPGADPAAARSVPPESGQDPETWPEFLYDWADAAAWTLATALRKNLPQQGPAPQGKQTTDR